MDAESREAKALDSKNRDAEGWGAKALDPKNWDAESWGAKSLDAESWDAESWGAKALDAESWNAKTLDAETGYKGSRCKELGCRKPGCKASGCKEPLCCGCRTGMQRLWMQRLWMQRATLQSGQAPSALLSPRRGPGGAAAGSPLCSGASQMSAAAPGLLPECIQPALSSLRSAPPGMHPWDRHVLFSSALEMLFSGRSRAEHPPAPGVAWQASRASPCSDPPALRCFSRESSHPGQQT